MGNIEKFDEIASRYDTEGRAAVAKIIAGAVRACVRNAKEKTALDYGCGTGLVGMELIGLFKTLIFMDASPNMAEQVRLKLSAAGIANAEACCGDLMSDVPPEIRADYLILSQVLLHVKETKELLSRAYAALNPGGRLFIIDFDKNEAVDSPEVHNGFVQAELIGILKQIGFKETSAETFYQAENLFMNKAASLFILEAVK